MGSLAPLYTHITETSGIPDQSLECVTNHAVRKERRTGLLSGCTNIATTAERVIVQSPTNLAITHKNLTLRNQNTLLKLVHNMTLQRATRHVTLRHVVLLTTYIHNL